MSRVVSAYLKVSHLGFYELLDHSYKIQCFLCQVESDILLSQCPVSHHKKGRF